MTKLTHPDLNKVIEVPERSARTLRRAGWVDVEDVPTLEPAPDTPEETPHVDDEVTHELDGFARSDEKEDEE